MVITMKIDSTGLRNDDKYNVHDDVFLGIAIDNERKRCTCTLERWQDGTAYALQCENVLRVNYTCYETWGPSLRVYHLSVTSAREALAAVYDEERAECPQGHFSKITDGQYLFIEIILISGDVITIICKHAILPDDKILPASDGQSEQEAPLFNEGR